MKKAVSILAIFFLISGFSFLPKRSHLSEDGVIRLSKISKLKSAKNLTFYKDYTRGSSVNADYSAGSGTGTFTATRGATTPATYVDALGVINLVTTSDIPRFQGGYYDSTGFHAQVGLMIEGARTNLVPKSYTMNDASWTATSVTVSDGATTDPAGGSNAASLTASAGNGTVVLASAVT